MFIKRFNYYLVGMLLAVSYTAPNYASVYSDVSVEYLNVKVDGVKLHPWNGRIKIGLPLAREFAVEAHYASSIQDDEINSLKLSISENKGVYARYQSPDTFSGMVVYLLFGYAWTTVETSGDFSIPEQEFESFSWGIGAEERVTTLKRLAYTLQFSRYYDNDDLLIEGLSFGLRYDF